jgi:hypothetical protein
VANCVKSPQPLPPLFGLAAAKPSCFDLFLWITLDEELSWNSSPQREKPMKRKPFATLALLIVSGFPAGVLGRMLPSFNLEVNAWEATHIVVVTQRDDLDVEVEILESWKGDLKTGDLISIPDLTRFVTEESREIKNRWFPAKGWPAFVHGDRMILFLIEIKQEQPVGRARPSVWKPAGNEMLISMAWVETGKAFGFVQHINPGPRELADLRTTELQMKDQVSQLLHLKKTLEDALAKSDLARIAGAAFPLFRQHSYGVGKRVMKLLKENGKTILPVLHQILWDEKSASWFREAIAAIKSIDSARVGLELAQVMEYELAFWRMRGPWLYPEWSIGNTEDEYDHLMYHHRRVQSALLCLEDVFYPGCSNAVSAFRDFWLRMPQLRQDESDGMGELCGRALAAQSGMISEVLSQLFPLR